MVFPSVFVWGPKLSPPLLPTQSGFMLLWSLGTFFSSTPVIVFLPRLVTSVFV